MSSEDLTSAVLAAASAVGLDACGVTDAAPFLDTRDDLEQRRGEGLAADMQFTYRNPERSTDPARTFESARSIVAAALAYDPPEVSGSAQPVGRVAAYAVADHYAELRRRLERVAEVISGAGHTARIVIDDNALVDRAVAHRAGLGWFGKNSNLLLPGKGSWFVLGNIVTDAPLVSTPPIVDDGCGGCRRCIDSCPTDAIVRPGVVDARRCLAWLVQAGGVFPAEHRVALGDRLYGCDDCQEVCPPNRREAPRRASAPTSMLDPQPWVPLLDLLACDDEEILRRHGRWYIAARDPSVVRRNALLALANTADPDDPEVQQALRDALVDERSMIRATALWAVRRLELESAPAMTQAVSTLSEDSAEEVHQELAAAWPPPRGAEQP